MNRMKSCLLMVTMVALFSLASTLSAAAQTVEVVGEVEDAFLGIPLQGVKVSILDTDSTVVVDSAATIAITGRDGKLMKMMFAAHANVGDGKCLVRATKPGYGEVIQPVSLTSVNSGQVTVPAIKMRKERNVNLDEVVVKATKVKMYYKGDTLVYNADAFKLPDGSMLDELIRQLPGVTMNDAGEIFVNGRKVDELLLGSRSFMRGNKKVLMENLPYYTVKNLKVYEKQTDKSEALGYDVEPRKYVMDVNLKNEYSRGYIANVEAAGGTRDRWLGRGFLLGFTNYWRYSLMGNLNNVNENRHIGENDHWSPATMPQSLLTTRSVATDLDYQSKGSNVKNNLNVDYTSSTDKSETRSRYEQFLDVSKPVSVTESRNRSGNKHLKLVNRLVLRKPAYFDFTTHFDYDKRHSSGLTLFRQWDDSLTATMRTDAMGEGRQWAFCQEAVGAFNVNKQKHWYGNFSFFFRHSDDQSKPASKFNTWQADTQVDRVRYNTSNVSNRMTNLIFMTSWTIPELIDKVNVGITEYLSFSDSRAHDYLYHPDTLLLSSQLDMLSAITDFSNSYDSHHRQWDNTVNIFLSRQASYKISFYNITYDRWRLELKVPVYNQSLDYKRGVIDTLARGTWVYFTPSFSYRLMSADGNRDFRMGVSYSSSPADLLSRIGYRDDSQPLVVREGSPGLKGKASTVVNANYTEKGGKRIRLWHVGATLNYNHRDVAQAVAYDTQTSIYTFRPANVRGAYTATARFDMSSDIGKNRYWTWQVNADASYNHSLDYAMLAGETESHENTVNTTILNDNAYIQYGRGTLNVRASSGVRLRHSEGKMRDFETLNATDFNYGLSARYTIPHLKTTLSADATMYSRRGYGLSGLNTDDFVLNASLSQSLWKGRVIASVEAFDLLHEVSTTQYSVNAQGRTEAWFRSLPNYVMFHLTFHWNKNPKKGL